MLLKFYLYVKILFFLIFMRYEKIKCGYFVFLVKIGVVFGCVICVCFFNDKFYVIYFI